MKDALRTVTPLSGYPLGSKQILFVPAGDWKKGDKFQNSQNGLSYKVIEISTSSGFNDGRIRLTTKQIK
jgi:hypothetical protein